MVLGEGVAEVGENKKVFYDYITQSILVKQWLHFHSSSEKHSCKMTDSFFIHRNTFYMEEWRKGMLIRDMKEKGNVY